MRLPAVDHLVYAAPNLKQAADQLEARLGVRAAAGGKHLGWGTHNALLSLGTGAYLEIIAPDPEQGPPERPLPLGLASLTEPRLVTWAVKAPAIDGRVALARAAGYDPGDVLALSRALPDGSRLDWRLTPPPTVGDGIVPFLIEWETAPHPSETAPAGCTLTRLRAEHPQPKQLGPMLAALGVELRVDKRSSPTLIATLKTPRGRVELR